jgi:hypothetical protein
MILRYEMEAFAMLEVLAPIVERPGRKAPRCLLLTLNVGSLQRRNLAGIWGRTFSVSNRADIART